ncbi:MAG: peptidoglycan DD-metalloendopeptidase family protein, partial [Ketobacter sp.]|nr:peptidoglycan DD-metalloendopeptidase family protein [Ketobacter sp.]
KREYEIRQTNTSGTIINSLFSSGREAGLTDSLIMDLANIFGWDIDFALEIRAGDSFCVIYEEKYLDGERQGNGAILAAEFRNRGKQFRAVRFNDAHGRSNYFSPDGKNMRKAFLRAPVDFRRISSKFTPTRWHPVLGKRRPHRGVDYAAKTGTPIKAAGDGKVIYRGRKGGYGNTLIIQHANHYTTLYAHLSKYRGSVKKGSRVKQGDIIG